MLSHETCSQGGQHEFDDTQEDQADGENIVHSQGCGKCGEVYRNEILVPDDNYEFEGCEPGECGKSGNDHEWHDDTHEYCSPDEYYVEMCGNCDGTRTLWYRHKHTTYNGPDGHDFHRHSA